jgi:hypothetical protein
LGHEEADSSSAATPALLTPLTEGPHVLDDGPEANVWSELVQRHGAFDELVSFFYDSFAVMASRTREFFGL